MRSFLFSLTFLLAACSLVDAAYLRLPQEVKGEVGAFLKVEAESDGKVIKWIVLDKGLNLFPTDLLKDSKTAVVYAAAQGKYRVLAYTASGDEPSDPAVCTVVVGGDNPSPPPPTPPQPVSLLQEAFNQETDPGKHEDVKKLSALYRQFAQTLNENRTNFSTWGNLFDTMNSAAKTMGVNGKVMKVQAVIQKDLQAKLPVNRDKQFTSADSSLASLTFTQVARSLDELK